LSIRIPPRLSRYARQAYLLRGGERFTLGNVPEALFQVRPISGKCRLASLIGQGGKRGRGERMQEYFPRCESRFRLNPQSFPLARSYTEGRHEAQVQPRRESTGGLAIMQGSEKVIAALNKALQEEFTALSQYFIHAEMCENWKYENLSKRLKKESIMEMKHAEKLIEHILFLDGTPNMNGPTQIQVGKTVKEQLANDLKAELDAVKSYNDAVKLARAEGDNGSAELFLSNLKDEEGHADWLESQLNLIKELGYERYLSKQMGEE
jgi:bacterioferritin